MQYGSFFTRIHQDRIEGLHFAVAGFTNLTHDHLDYHKTFDESEN